MISIAIEALLFLYFPFTLIVIIFYTIIYEPKSLIYIKMIVSELPAGQLSQDDNFHEYANNSSRRFSLFYLPIGIYKIYFFTWTRDKKFHFLKILSLKDIYNQQIQDKEDRLELITDKSFEEYSKSNNIEQKQHLALLQDLTKQMQETEKTAQFKAMFYITTLAAILSVLISKFNEIEKILILNTYEQVVIALIILYILNALFLLLSFLSVGGYKSETYSDFKNSKQKEKTYFEYWYKQYQRLQKYSERDVSFIANIEKYLKITTFWTIILALLFLLEGTEICNKNLTCQDMNLTCKIIK